MPRIRTTEKDQFSFFDKLPPLGSSLRAIGASLDSVAEFYRFETIATPALEDTRLVLALARAGMLDFRQPILCKSGRGADFAIRPSGIPGILRAYDRHKLNDTPHPLKFIFSGESFYAVSKAHEGGLRNVFEWGLCMIGEAGAVAEAEIVQVIWKSLEKLGADVNRIQVRVNATTCDECRPEFRSALLSFLRPKGHKFCKQCKKFVKKGPTKVFRCAEEQCGMFLQNAPQLLDYLCESCKKHLRSFLEFLDEAKIPYFLDARLFKEGSFYHTLIFELAATVVHADVPKQAEASGEAKKTSEAPKAERILLAEGGRISRAAEVAIGKRIDVAAATLSLELLENFLVHSGAITRESKRQKIFLAQLGDLAKRKSLLLIEELRGGDIQVHESLGRDSIKSQLKVAERIGAELSLIMGQKEALDNTIIVREMKSGTQETVPQERLIEFLKRKLRNI